MLEFHNITITPHLRDVSLFIDDGRIGCIEGGSGSGKTALLRAVLGLLPVDEGHICIDGELLTPLSAPYFREMMAYVPQQLSLPYDYDTVGELTNMLFGLRVHRDVRHRAGQDDGRRWVQLSCAERYMVLLNNAVQLGKPLLLVDEPPLLSAAQRDDAASMLVQAARQGATVLVVNQLITDNIVQI